MLLLVYTRISSLLIVISSLFLYSCTPVSRPSSHLSVLSPSTPQWALSAISTPTYGYISKSGFATICGTLTLMNPALVAPQEDGLYLVIIDVNDRNTIIVPTIDQTSYRATVDEITGQFCFKDIPPGIYVILAMTDNGMEISVRSFETGQIMVVTVTQNDLNKVIDLGMTRLP